MLSSGPNIRCVSDDDDAPVTFALMEKIIACSERPTAQLVQVYQGERERERNVLMMQRNIRL